MFQSALNDKLTGRAARNRQSKRCSSSSGTLLIINDHLRSGFVQFKPVGYLLE